MTKVPERKRQEQDKDARLCPPALLPWHFFLAYYILGILASKFFLEASLLAFLCACLFSYKKRIRPLAPLFFILFFAFGFFYASISLPKPPQSPPWLEQHFAQSSRSAAQNTPLLITAEITQVKKLDKDRLQLLLKNIQSQNKSSIPFEGISVWTGKYKGALPLEGQQFTAHVVLAPIRGLVNEHVWNYEEYQHMQDIWLRAYTPQKYTITISGEGSWLARYRSSLQTQLESLLQLQSDKEGTKEVNTKKERMDEQSKALLPALLFGDRSFISKQNTDYIAKSTLAHSLALSGLHLSYALFFGLLVAQAIKHIFPQILLKIAFPQLTLLVGLPFALIYLWLGAAPISLMRAFCMYIAILLFCFFKKPYTLLDSLGLALWGILMFSPLSAFDLRLQLSSLSICAILLFLPLGRNISAYLFHKNTKTSHLLACIFDLLYLSTCIQLFLFPLIVFIFNAAGVWVPLNIIWLPILGAWLMPFAFLGLFCIALSWLKIASILLYLASLPCKGLLLLLHWMQKLGILYAPILSRPDWSCIVSFWLFCTLCILACERVRQNKKRETAHVHTLNKKIYALSFCIICLLTYSYVRYAEENKEGLSIKIYDVGHAQAIGISWNLGEEKGRALLDGGNLSYTGFDMGKSIIAPALSYMAKTELDWIINSHTDSDHLGGLLFLLDTFTVKNFAKSDDIAADFLQKRLDEVLKKRQISPRVYSQGEKITLSKTLVLHVLWPKKSSSQSIIKNRNERSLVLRLDWEEQPIALFCGDISSKELEEILQENSISALQVPLFIIPHHGSPYSYHAKFYEQIAPQLAIASARYVVNQQFIADNVMQALDQKKTTILSTAQYGEIDVYFSSPSSKAKYSWARKELK